LETGVSVRTAYIDTVGNPDYYRRKLEHEFSGIDFVVESKADAKYAPCSAASVGKCMTLYLNKNQICDMSLLIFLNLFCF
jgi:hypothetical protein